MSEVEPLTTNGERLSQALPWLVARQPLLKYAPVFGGMWFQVVYLALVAFCSIDMLLAIIWHPDEVEAFIERFALPARGRNFLYAFPCLGIISGVKLVLGKQLLVSTSLDELFMEVGEHAHEEDCRVELEKAQKKVVNDSIISVVAPAVFGVLFRAADSFIGCGTVSPDFFPHCFLPFLVINAASFNAKAVVQFAADLGEIRVNIICKELAQLRTDPGLCVKCERYWSMKLDEYFDIDTKLTRVCVFCGNVIAAVISANLVGAYFSVLGLFVFEHVTLQLACSVMLVWNGGVILGSIWPMAKLSDRCSSSNAGLARCSLLLEFLQCGSMKMDASDSSEYIRLVNSVKACPIGARLPVLGLVTTSDLMTYAKVIAALVPTLLTRSLATLAESDAPS